MLDPKQTIDDAIARVKKELQSWVDERLKALEIRLERKIGTMLLHDADAMEKQKAASAPTDAPPISPGT